MSPLAEPSLIAAVERVPFREQEVCEEAGRPSALCAAALEVRDLRVSYRSGRALDGLSLTVPAGQFLVLTGPSGCGKSTLALAVGGLLADCAAGSLAPEARGEMEGRVLVFGRNMRETPPQLRARHVGIVFQSPAAQLFHGVVEDEVAFAPRNLGLAEHEVARRVDFALKAVGIRPLAGRPTQGLSSGEKQRLAVASALSLQPRLLVLDEPAANLDREGVELLASSLRRLNREWGLTVLLIEHRLQPFLPLADRLVLLEAGRLAADGRPSEVLSVGRRPLELGLQPPQPAHAAALPAPRPDCGLAPTAPLVRLQRLCAGYGRHRVLHDVDLELFPGEFVALIGPNGSGKSTLARVLAGMHRPQRGRVQWGAPWRRLPPGRRVGFLFQNAPCQLLMDTVEEEVAFAPRNLGLDAVRSAEWALSAAGLLELRARPTSALSVGEQQRTALAAVLAASPALLVLDEPTVGQDWGHLRRLTACLRRLARGGTAVLLITHDERLVRGFARRVARLDRGRLDSAPRHEREQPEEVNR